MSVQDDIKQLAARPVIGPAERMVAEDAWPPATEAQSGSRARVLLYLRLLYRGGVIVSRNERSWLMTAPYFVTGPQLTRAELVWMLEQGLLEYVNFHTIMIDGRPLEGYVLRLGLSNAMGVTFDPAFVHARLGAMPAEGLLGIGLLTGEERP